MAKSLTRKQKSVLLYFQEQKQLLGTAPRLIDAARRFKVTSKAILDNLRALEKKGYISMENGKVENTKIIQAVPALYDIFISYAHADKERVKPIIDELEQRGFYVWIDEREIKVGDNLIAKINHGLEKSKFFAIVLSQNSIKSQWVKEEINYITSKNIESRKALIRPILLDKCEIPPLLKTVLYADFTNNEQVGMNELLRSLDIPVAPISVKSAFEKKIKDYDARIKEYREKIDKQYSSAKTTTKAYKEWVLAPQGQAKIKTQDIKGLIDKIRVRFQRFGGMPLPTEIYKVGKEVRQSNGFGYIDADKEIGGITPFYYWFLDANGIFIARYSLREDEIVKEREMTEYENTLSLDWLIKDVVASLMLARNLLTLIPEMEVINVENVLHGMQDRQLKIYNKSRAGLFWPYRSSQEVIKKSVTVTIKSDLKQIALEMLAEFSWLFGWDNPNERQFELDIESLLNGVYPE